MADAVQSQNPSRRKPTQAEVIERFKYEPETGIFTSRCSGVSAGTIDKRGYQKLSINSRQWLAHRLAWLYVTGEWPDQQIDHANRNKSDNRFANLRLATPSQNMANKTAYRHSRTGVRGVHKRPNGKYRVQFSKNGRAVSFGDYETLEAARNAAISASAELHGEFSGYLRGAIAFRWPNRVASR
jgi:hypothetical protein